MTAENFVYWLQGFIEITECDYNGVELSEQQVQCIKDHIKLVLKKETPNREGTKNPFNPLMQQRPLSVQYPGVAMSC